MCQLINTSARMARQKSALPPIPAESLQSSETTRCAMCGRLRVGKENLHVAELGRVQPCVRPVSAVRMTVGHNALRGSGPGHNPAFDHALAHVGCPDRQIDRLCITCCSPFQLSHPAGWPAGFRSRCERDGFLVALTLRHHGPSHSRDLVGERDCGHLGRPPRQERRELGPMLSAMELA
jgi:hypothetical protein